MHGGMEALAPRSRVDVAIRLAAVHRREAMWRGRKNVADLVVALHDGGDRRELRRADVVEGVDVLASNGQIQLGGLIDTGPATIAVT